MTVWSCVWRGVSGTVVRMNGGPRGASTTSRLTTLSSPSCRARCWLSTTSSDNERQQQLVVSTVYVHPLSQIVLQYLQKECHDWICARQLDGNLRLHRDGTFVLETMTTTNDSSSPKQQQQCREQEASLDENETESSSDDDDDASSYNSASSTPLNMTTTKTRIWTYYDLADKKHWLSYSSSIVPAAATSSGDEKGGDTTKAEDKASSATNISTNTTRSSSHQQQTTMSSSNCQHSFLLQDNMMPAWHGNHRRTSLVDRVQESVRELVQVADQEHAKQQQQAQQQHVAAATASTPSSSPSQANKTNKKKKRDNNTDE